MIAKRAHAARRSPALRGLVAAGEALNPEVLRAWHEATGLWIRDGYGQTETGQLTGMPLGRAGRARARWAAPLPGVALDVVDGELVADPATDPDVLPPLPRRATPPPAARGAPATASAATTTASCYFEGRTDDVIISAGYRIGPFEVESALVAHPAVAEAAVVAAPDDERGSVVRAVVVLRDGYAPSDALARELQDHVKARDRAVQVPARRRLRRRAAQDGERQGPPRGAARWLDNRTDAATVAIARHDRHRPDRPPRSRDASPP